MANLRDIRDRISSVKNTQQITRAMKMVAAARLRKAQDRMTAARPYTYKLREVIARVTERTESENPLLKPSENPSNILILVMGSDRGLCGGFNTNLFRFIENKISDDFSIHLQKESLSLLCFGKKAYDYFRVRQYPVLDHKTGFFDNLNFESVVDVSTNITQDFRNRTYDEVYLAFNEFKSVMAQKRKFIKFLPLDAPESSDSVTGNHQDETKSSLSDIDYLYEPKLEQTLSYLLPLFLNVQLWQASLESFAAEQGARMTAMDSATENAGDIIRDLQLKYNQARQAAITTEISEIVSGAEALKE